MQQDGKQKGRTPGQSKQYQDETALSTVKYKKIRGLNVNKIYQYMETFTFSNLFWTDRA
jgi:hypothetical protein